MVPIRIPALRERKNDIPLLASHFLEQAAEHARKAARLSEDALSLMMDYNWPGNVRELQNAIHFALVKSQGRNIEAEHLPLEIRREGMHGFEARPRPAAHARGRCIGHREGRGKQVQSGEASPGGPCNPVPVFGKDA